MLQQFFGDVLPRTGYFCVFDAINKQHHWAESHEELIGIVQRRADLPAQYYGTASYDTTFNRKKSNVRALRALRLDIDVAKPNDPNGTYPNQKAALVAIRSFIATTGLEPTYIVGSGKGFHLYWCMDADCKPVDWEPMAAGLQRLGERHGLLIDTTCTTDTARILRAPGTTHHEGVRVQVKLETKRIWSVADLRGRLVSANAASEPRIEPAAPGKYDMSVNADVQITHVQRPPVSAIAVAEKCEALRYAASVGGDVPEPYWRAMLGLVKHTIEGEDLAHEWSMGHPDYDEDQTQKKLDGWTAGPTTCAEFANHTKACEACPHRGTVRSPVLLVNPPLPAQESPAAPVSTPVAVSPAAPAPAKGLALTPQPSNPRPWEAHLPPKYSVNPNAPKPGHTMVYMMPTGENTEDGQPIAEAVPFTHTVFWAGHWADAEEESVARVQVYKLDPEGTVSAFTLDQDVMASKNKLIEFLGGRGIQITNHPKATMAIQHYTRDAVQQIVHSGKRMQIADHLGMRIMPNGGLVATQGFHTIFPDGHIERSMLSKKLEGVAGQFAIPLPHDGVYGEWKPDVWPYIEERARQHVAFLQKYYGGPGMERFQLAIMMGLASPFMPFVTGEFQHGSILPRGGLSVSLFSRESARGKTTAVQSAILAYGKPAALTNDGGALGATENARVSRLTIHGTLPNIMDEMGSATPEEVANAVHMVANGASRERANREGGLNISAPWALINLITTNTSQRDMIANVQESSDAIQRRLLEINVDGMPDHNRDDRHSFAREWTEMNSQCVGALGAVIHREIVKMGLANVTALTMGCVEKADKATGAKVAERFQYRGLGAVMALHLTLTKIGIEVFPLKGVFEAFKVAHDSGSNFIAENVMPTDGLEILSRLLHDLQRYTLVTEGETRRVNGRPDIEDTMLNERMPDVVHARHIKSAGRTYVSVEAAKRWCREHNVPESEITKRCRDERIFTLHGSRNLSAEKFNLLKGMRQSTNTFVQCYWIDRRMLAAKLGVPFDVPIPPAEAGNVRQLHAT